LVGHSLGGVVALETVIGNPDVQPMIRAVVTVDSPLLGLSTFRESQWLGWYGLGYCNSMDSLVPRNQAKSATLARLQNGAQQLLNRGIWVTTIVNDGDNLFIGARSDQGIGMNVTAEAPWIDSGTNHNAVLNTPEGIQTILSAIP
jgi:pimeloyl-ACP methyl ester carboxylesterase